MMVSSLRPPEKYKRVEETAPIQTSSDIHKQHRYRLRRADRLKCVLVVINTFMFVIGCICFGIAVYGLIQYQLLGYNELFKSVTIVTITPWVAVVCSTIAITMTPFYACYGAVAQRKDLLIIYFLYILSMLIIDLGTCIWTVIRTGQIQDEVEESIRTAVNTYPTDIYTKTALDDLQRNLECCGSDHGVMDFGTRGPPFSCAHDYLLQPCNKSIVNLYKDYRFIAMGVFAGLAFILMVTMATILMLLSAMKKWRPPRPPERRKPDIAVIDVSNTVPEKAAVVHLNNSNDSTVV